MPGDTERPLKLLDQVRLCCRRRHYSKRTGEAYSYWVRRYVLFHRKNHPRELAQTHVRAFLDDLVNRGAAATTHAQALCALVFLYRDVLDLPFEWLAALERPKRPGRVPVVLGRVEVRQALASMQGKTGLMARLIYGSGLRLNECVQ